MNGGNGGESESFFERRIVSKTLNIDGTADVTYECGHSAVWIIPPHGDSTPCCVECLEIWRLQQHAG